MRQIFFIISVLFNLNWNFFSLSKFSNSVFNFYESNLSVSLVTFSFLFAIFWICLLAGWRKWFYLLLILRLGGVLIFRIVCVEFGCNYPVIINVKKYTQTENFTEFCKFFGFKSQIKIIFLNLCIFFSLYF